MLLNKCHLIRHIQNSAQLRLSLSFCLKSALGDVQTKPATEKPRYNAINIQMLSDGLHRQIFGKREDISDPKALDAVMRHLKTHGIPFSETSTVPDVDFTLPKLLGENIGEHFRTMAKDLTDHYRRLLLIMVKTKLPDIPKKWVLQAGWTKYDSSGFLTSVPYPEEEALVFDVEVCVQEGHYPTLATAVSNKHWYLWCSERLVEEQFAWSQGISPSDLIPLGKEKKKLIIGHNVAFDRAFIKEQYLLKRDDTLFIDTMSLHMCVSGLTGLQRALSIATKKESTENEAVSLPVTWGHISSLNNLADVYKLYCDGAELDKSEREVFMSGTMADIKEKFSELSTYCARDVVATHNVLKKLVPMFFDRFPQPVTFAGLLEMCSVYLPVNQNWERYLRDTQDTYDDLQKELKLSLMHLANDACSYFHDDMYKKDPWLWDFDWSVQDVRFRKMPQTTVKRKKKKGDEAEPKEVETDIEMKLSEEAEEEICAINKSNGDSIKDPTIKRMYESAASLRKVRPFMPGYPVWYRELCDKNKDKRPDWEPGPILISSQMRCVPKLMRLTWDGYPLHYDAKHGWGYLVPNGSQNCLSNDIFPLEQLVSMTMSLKDNSKKDANSSQLETFLPFTNVPEESSYEKRKLWQAVLKNLDNSPQPCDDVEGYGIGPYDVGICGCSFYRLPHKDGPHKRVGNPLSKDFLPKMEDGTLRCHGQGQSDRALLLSKMLSYWKNANQRIMSQMVVWLNKEELSETVTSDINYDENSSYGAILPRLVPAGTVTRRAVEPTWLTASNAYSDRVGSELKSMVQAPPGYHFVGADVDSQELWIAAILGDSHFGKIHGCTAFGWMTLQGKKSAGTDMHSRTANSVGVSRNEAKVLNYARIYGAGKAFTQRLLMQFNHRLSPSEAKQKVKKIYAETKGTRRFSNAEKSVDQDDNMGCSAQKKFWQGGSESHLFNKLEEIALSAAPKTPVLDCRISRALEPKAVDTNFMTSRVNWVVQSSAVDYLHLMLVSMKWLFRHYKIDGRLSICIHDEVRFLVSSSDVYRASLALQITNLWTRSYFAFKLGMHDLPQSVAFFSSVDIDKALRKEVNMDSITPSNPHGLEKGYGIPPGEAFDIYDVLQKTGGSLER